MQTWLMTTLMAAALLFAAAPLGAQPAEPPPPPAPPTGPAPQPANDAAQEQGLMDDADEAEAHARRILEQQLRELTARQRALAAARIQVQAGEVAGARVQVQGGDGAGGVARFRVGVRAKTEKAAWLGVATSKVPQALRQHLDLKNKYIGLVVERVEPDSPAEEAGLEQFDIIERVNDQWIVNTEQFSVVLRMNEPGAEVNLAIIRKGKPQELKVRLAEKELPVLGMNEGFDFFQLAPAAEVGRANLIDIAPQGRVIIRDGMLDPLLDLERLNKVQNAQIIVKDDEHTLKVTTTNGSRHLEASDANGVVFFEGPIDTEEELAAVPEEIRDKVRKIDQLPRAAKRSKTPATRPGEASE